MNSTLLKVAPIATISTYNRYIYTCAPEKPASLILYCCVILSDLLNRKFAPQSSIWASFLYRNYLWYIDILISKKYIKILAAALSIYHISKYVVLSFNLKKAKGFQRRYFIYTNWGTRTAGIFKILKLPFLKTFSSPITVIEINSIQILNDSGNGLSKNSKLFYKIIAQSNFNYFLILFFKFW